MGDLEPWHRLSPYAITNGRHHVAKLLSNGQPGYLLWLDGRLVHQCFDTSTAAKAHASEHERAHDVNAKSAGAGDANDGAHGGDGPPENG